MDQKVLIKIIVLVFAITSGGYSQSEFIGPDFFDSLSADVCFPEHYEKFGPDSFPDTGVVDTIWVEGECDSVSIYTNLEVAPGFVIPMEVGKLVRRDSCNVHMETTPAATQAGFDVDTTVNLCQIDSQTRVSTSYFPLKNLAASINPSGISLWNYHYINESVRLRVLNSKGKLIFNHFMILAWGENFIRSNRFIGGNFPDGPQALYLRIEGKGWKRSFPLVPLQ